jgi:hypothetical protein
VSDDEPSNELAEPGDLASPPYPRLSDAALGRLAHRVTAIINNGGIPLDSYTPEPYVEGHIESATLYELRVETTPTVLEGYVADVEPDEPSYQLVVQLEGDGEVVWVVNHPVGGDYDTFASEMEGLEDGGGHFYCTDEVCPIVIQAHVEFVPRIRGWAELELHDVSLAPSERERRSALHATAEIDQLIDLGLLSPEERDDETGET